MGEVWRARDTRLGRDVAIKVLPGEFASDPERLKRFEREAKATASLSHPNILDVHDVGTHEGVPYLVEELLEGESLKERLERGALPVPEAVRIACEVAKGLSAAHGKGIVHRDLKPGNVFLTADGRVKVLDFGLAKLVGTVPLGEAETLTQAPTATTEFGSVMGTVAYMAPEQARGMPVDLRTDVFAFGVVLYEMLVGERPFRGATGTDVVAAILKEEPAPLPASVPPELAAVVTRCLAKEPGERYQHGGEVEAALQGIQALGPVSLWPSLTRSLRRHPWLVAANAVVALVLLALLLDVGGVRRQLLGGSSSRVIRMAVLPFANLSGDPQQEYLSDGVTQEMIAQLGRLHPGSLSVIARTSVMRYKRTDTPIDKIGRELGVDYVLEGSAQREAGRIRISAELIQVRDQTQLWADVYERELSGIFALQSDVAQKVAGALALKLLPAEKAQLASARTVNPEAYEAYLKGSQAWIKMTKGDLDTAEGYFNLAIQKEPGYAAAYAGLATVWGCRNQMGYARQAEAVPRMKQAALKAVSLDDTLAEAHVAVAGLKTWHDWDLPAAGPEWERAVELNPSSADSLAMYSHYLAIMGRTDQAIARIDRALSLDPFDVTVHSFRGVVLIMAHRYDDALAEYHKVQEMEPANPVSADQLWGVLAATEKGKRAADAAKEYFATVAGFPEFGALMDQGFAEGGFPGAMRRAAGALAARAANGGRWATGVAALYAYAGDKGLALDWLERAYEERDPNLPYLRLPELDSLRDEPRFQALAHRLGIPLS